MNNDIISELSRKNAHSFNITVKDQNNKLLAMQLEIDGLKNTISVLQERLNDQQNFINFMRIKYMGNGPTSV
jgi:hypothetical protein